MRPPAKTSGPGFLDPAPVQERCDNALGIAAGPVWQVVKLGYNPCRLVKSVLSSLMFLSVFKIQLPKAIHDYPCKVMGEVVSASTG
jgi:hypothetical protein